MTWTVRLDERTGRLYMDGGRRAGKRVREFTRLPGTPRNRASLERKAEAMNHEAGLGAFDYLRHFPEGRHLALFDPGAARRLALGPHAAPAYAEWGRRCLDQKKGSVRPATWEGYERFFRVHLLPALAGDGKPPLGERRVDEIAPSDARDLKAALEARGAGRRLVKGVMGLLREHLRLAALEVPGARDATAGIRLPSAPRMKADPFAPGEVRWILHGRRAGEKDPRTGRALKAARGVDPWYAELFAALFGDGFRASEVFALRWPLVDRARGRLEVAASRVRGREGEPKTARSGRVVELSPMSARALQAQAQKTLMLAGGEGYVFTTPPRYTQRGELAGRSARPLSDVNLSKQAWLPALKRLGLRRRGLNQTRHTFITLALEAGENIRWVADHCGTSEEMILRHYKGHIPARDARPGERVAGAMEGAC